MTGASGRLGDAIVKELWHRGVPFSGCGRGTAPPSFGGVWHRVNLLDGEGLDAACEARPCVVHCATQPDKPKNDLVALEQLIAAARRLDLHIVFIGIAGIEDAAAHLSYYRVKLDCEHRLVTSGVRHTIVRPTIFHSFVDEVLQQLTVGPFLLTPKMILQPMDIEFAAEEIVSRSLNPSSMQAHDICGPQRLDTVKLVEPWLINRVSRHKLKIPLPSVGPLKALSTLRRVDGKAGGLTWSQWLTETNVKS